MVYVSRPRVWKRSCPDGAVMQNTRRSREPGLGDFFLEPLQISVRSRE